MSTIASDQPLIPPVLPASVPNVALPLDKELVLKVIPMPADCNANGDIFGGWVMAQVDLAGSVIPARHTQGRMATVAVNEFIFKQPVRVGDILSFFFRSHAGRADFCDGEGGSVCRTLQESREIHQSDRGIGYLCCN